MTNNIKRFRAPLEPLPGNLGWTVARIPFDVSKSWKKMVRLRVKVEAGGQIFRTSLFPDSTHGGHFVVVNKRMQKAAGVKTGGMIDLAVEPDIEKRDAQVPAELATIFKKEKAVAQWYAKQSDATKHDIENRFAQVKSPEARRRRADQLAERVLSALEGEKELPPILEIAFRRNPVARKGWEQMTPLQRRGHLLGIFYYKSPEAREKRTGKAVQECLRVMEKKRSAE
ncbi:MAG: DUF1905 domain-containing protein [Acidobacteria bacterium]|nr:DUF1905 domain-containing protein [Acidobacteriota bacterium]